MVHAQSSPTSSGLACATCVKRRLSTAFHSQTDGQTEGENLCHTPEFPKRARDRGVKPRSYAPGDKVWLNSKYIKIKRNRKLEAKFFGPFRVLHPVGPGREQAYKLELPKKWRIHVVFHLSMLEQDTTRKRRVYENATRTLLSWILKPATPTRARPLRCNFSFSPSTATG